MTAAAPREEAGMVRCPLCGAEFPDREACPAGCPMAKGCHTLCCPYCHYRFVQESSLTRFIGRLVRRRRR